MSVEKVLDVFAWPLAAIVGVFLVALVFRGPISKLLGRITAFKYGDAAVETAAEAPRASIELQKEEQPATPAGPIPTVPAAHAMPPAFPMLEQFERGTREELERLALPRELERAWLIRAWALADYRHAHEITFRTLLGSQINLLHAAASVSPPDAQAARAIFDRAKVEYPALYEGFSYEMWLNYPVTRGLVHMDGARIRATLTGQDFLKYLVDFGLTFPKVG
jgi:hypothetical protein